MPALENPRHERFYVYAVRIGGRTRYVGKGCGKRAFLHLRRSHNPVLRAEIEAARRTGQAVRVRIMKSGLSEVDAFRIERRMIAKWSDRLVNVAMGSHSATERLAMECVAHLSTLKLEDDVRREGSWSGICAERRIEVLRQVRRDLERFSVAV